MKNTQVKEIMKAGPVTVSPGATLEEAAKQMRDVDCGCLPVGSKERLQGIITDRDIVTRAVARGKDITKEQVKDYMTPEIHTCRETATLHEAAEEMRRHNVSRLIVEDKAGRATGILSFGSILRKEEDRDEMTDVVCCATGSKAA